MMLIISINVMCSYLYSVFLVSQVLKNTYLKEPLSVVAFNIAYGLWKTILWELNYVKCLNIAPMKKAWFMALMEEKFWHNWICPNGL